MATDWLAKRRKEWSDIHTRSRAAPSSDVYPRIGKLPIKDIKPAMVSAVVEAIVKRGARDTASKVLQHVGGVAIREGAAEMARGDRR